MMNEKLKNQLRTIRDKIIIPLKIILQKSGYTLIKNYYYSPIPDRNDLSKNYWVEKSELIGLDIKSDNILQLLSDLNEYILEFRKSVPLYENKDNQIYLINSTFMAIDAHIYYSFIRYFKPKQIIEIGSGYSTLFANLAVQNNNVISNITAIEPYPSSLLKNLASQNNHLQIISQKLQDIDIDFFSSLKANDILFIDSTHMLRTGSDVQIEYCEILPRLAPGVLVHIHDISLPKHYPSVYFDNELYWNEQYLLQAFLSFNSKFEIIWPGNYMMIQYPEILCDKFPEFEVMRQHFPMSEPTSFWIRVKE